PGSSPPLPCAFPPDPPETEPPFPSPSPSPLPSFDSSLAPHPNARLIGSTHQATINNFLMGFISNPQHRGSSGEDAILAWLGCAPIRLTAYKNRFERVGNELGAHLEVGRH